MSVCEDTTPLLGEEHPHCHIVLPLLRSPKCSLPFPGDKPKASAHTEVSPSPIRCPLSPLHSLAISPRGCPHSADPLCMVLFYHCWYNVFP